MLHLLSNRMIQVQTHGLLSRSILVPMPTWEKTRAHVALALYEINASLSTLKGHEDLSGERDLSTLNFSSGGNMPSTLS